MSLGPLFLLVPISLGGTIGWYYGSFGGSWGLTWSASSGRPSGCISGAKSREISAATKVSRAVKLPAGSYLQTRETHNRAASQQILPIKALG